MKLRRLVDDFRVTEVNSLPIGRSGTYAVYELEKTGWTTLDALSHFSRTINLPRRNIAHAGLKDRHAVTRQIVTIRNGPRRSWNEESLSLTYLGQAPRETRSSDITGNRFILVVRSLPPGDQTRLEQTLTELRATGMPNYFDDQRFGSWYAGHGFIGEAWVREDYEKALWLTFAEHHPDDDSAERRQKAILRDNWKDWQTCKQLLDRSHRRSIVTYLCDKPADFKGAWGIVNGDLRGLFLSALQSDLWNRMVSQWMQENSPEDLLIRVPLKTGPVNFPRQFPIEQTAELQQKAFPLPSSRVKRDEEPDAAWMESTLKSLGWSFAELKVKFPRDRFFSRARRPVWVPLSDLNWSFAPDELDSDRICVTLSFTLPAGSYATIFIKCLWPGNTATAVAASEANEESPTESPSESD